MFISRVSYGGLVHVLYFVYRLVKVTSVYFNSELWWADPVDWHSIRGPQMIILMKMVSVGFDLDSSLLPRLPTFMEMVGYIVNPGTVIFGPWVSFSAYKKVLQPMSWVSLAC